MWEMKWLKTIFYSGRQGQGLVLHGQGPVPGDRRRRHPGAGPERRKGP